MTPSPIQHIVFDVGRVLLHWDPELAFLEIIPDETERRWFFDNVCTAAWNLEQDRGRSWADAEAQAIERHPDHAASIKAFRSNWHAMVPHAYEDSVVLLRGLIRDGHDVTLLTNFAADTFREARNRFEFLDEARGVTVSAEVGLLKPQAEIYHTHVENFALQPGATLFIDDSPANVEGARAAGWQAVLFTDANTLRRDLRNHAVSI